MAYIHKCFTNADGTWDEDAGGTEIELLAVIPATLRPAAFGNGRTFWVNDTSDLSEDSQGVSVSSIYCKTCEKFVVDFNSDYVNGRELISVEDGLTDGEFEQDGIVWVED